MSQLPLPDEGKFKHYYSRLSAPNASRLEKALSSLLGGYVLTYTTGLSALHAILAYKVPNVIAIGDGYHGCHAVIELHKKIHGLVKVDLHNEATWDNAGLGKGDIVHVETPLNPTGIAVSIEAFAEKAHRRGAYLCVDATLGPPSLQDPFAHGADFVMHSGTKYIGGHSDMLCGVLAVRDREWYRDLYKERLVLGSVMGNMEAWLGLRSLRTLSLRVQRQSKNAEMLVRWLQSGLRATLEPEPNNSQIIQKVILSVQHASLQPAEDLVWLKKQMPNGFGAVFAIWMKNEAAARKFPSKLQLFRHATSLGGVESLIEWRKMSDPCVDGRLLRVSVGVENYVDLRDDLMAGLRAIQSDVSNGNGD